MFYPRRLLAHWVIVAWIVLLVTQVSSLAIAVPLPAFQTAELPNRLTFTRLGGIADVTGDGRLDLLVGGGTGIFVLPGNGSFKFPNWYRAADDQFYVSTIATADFNNDGMLDVVADGSSDPDAPSTHRALRVWLADKGGQFHRTFEIAPHTAGSLHTGDFNGDGIADFVVARSEWSANIQPYNFRGWLETYIGDGRGGFTGPVPTLYPLTNILHAITYAGDLTGDGHTDIVTEGQFDWAMDVWIADATGGFHGPLKLISPPIPRDAVFQDEPPRPEDMVGGDLNGDGRQDLLVRFHYMRRDPEYQWGDPTEFTSMYLGDGSGHFGAPLPLAEPADHQRTVVEQVVADVNNDGRADILLTSSNHFTNEGSLYNIARAVDVYLGTGSGLFSGPLLSPNAGGVFWGGQTIQDRLYDLDGDGRLDLVSLNFPAINFARGDGKGNFTPAAVAGAFDPHMVAGAVTADFNDDGNVDVAVPSSGTASVSVWLGDGRGGWSGPINYAVGAGETPLAIVAADLNGDGRIDLATASPGYETSTTPRGISVLYGDGAGRFALGRQLQTGVPSALVAADFDGDGTIDLAVADNATLAVDLFFDFAGESRHITVPTGLAPRDPLSYPLAALATADFDRDGYPDLALGGDYTGANRVLLHVGDMAQRRVIPVPMPNATHGIAAGDIDGDGAADLAFTSYDNTSITGVILIARGDGKGGFQAPSKTSVEMNYLPDNIAIVDLGTAQRAVITDYNGIQVFPANTDGSLGMPVHFGNNFQGGLRNIAVADVNHDGLLDLIRPDATFLNLGACGNGRREVNEECDDGNNNPCDGCSATCHLEVGAVCGDGIVNAVCGEQCDVGEGNRNLPDTCRTDCQAPRCGDGIVDAGEECDDGNTYNCDGCSAHCTIDPAPVCGDGIINDACGEQCDDGNRIDGDGCSFRCQHELIPGGGSAKTDCLAEWIVVNPHNTPLRDAKGRISAKHVCHDNDPSCDFDGGVSGSCTFHIGFCVGMTDDTLPRCKPDPLSRCDVMKPSPMDATRSTAAAGMRTQLTAAMQDMMAESYGECSSDIEVTVPATGHKQTVKTRAVTVTGQRDIDTLKFMCVP